MMEFARNVDTDINIKYRYWVAQQIGREHGTIDEDIYNRLIRLIRLIRLKRDRNRAVNLHAVSIICHV